MQLFIQWPITSMRKNANGMVIITLKVKTNVSCTPLVLFTVIGEFCFSRCHKCKFGCLRFGVTLNI